jgi:hypothetical protein
MGTGAFVQIVVVFSGQCSVFAKTAGCQASASVIGSEKDLLAPIQCDMAGFHSSGDLQIILERKLAGAGIDPIGGNMPGFLVLIGTVKHIVPDGQKAGVLLSFRSGTQSKTTGFPVQDILVDTFASGFVMGGHIMGVSTHIDDIFHEQLPLLYYHFLHPERKSSGLGF